MSAAGGKVGTPINVVPAGWNHTDGMAMTPNGKTIYVVDDKGLVPVSTATGTPGKAIRVPAEPGMVVRARIAITPDGRTVYVTTSAGRTIAAVSTVTGRVIKLIRIGTKRHGSADSIAVTPDGGTVYVADTGDGTIVPISTATNRAGRSISIGKPDGHGEGPSYIAIGPGGTTAYVSAYDAVYPVNLADGKAGRPMTVAPAGFSAVAIAITFDGKSAWVVSDGDGSSKLHRGFLTPIGIATSTPGRPIMVGRDPTCVLLLVAPEGRASTSIRACADLG